MSAVKTAKEMAEWTGLEPATPGVTGRYSNQLNYHSAKSCVLYAIYFYRQVYFSIYTAKLSPQPHVPVTFGLLNLNASLIPSRL